MGYNLDHSFPKFDPKERTVKANPENSAPTTSPILLSRMYNMRIQAVAKFV